MSTRIINLPNGKWALIVEATTGARFFRVFETRDQAAEAAQEAARAERAAAVADLA